MTAPVTYGLEDQTIEEAAAILKQSAIKRLPVLDADHRLIGMVSIDDLLLELPRDAMAATAAFHAVADIERPGL
jgi:Mg/Co/Ni transporter MgtE